RPGGGHGHTGLRDAGRDPAAQGRRARRAVRAGRAGDRGAGGGRQRARADGRAEPARGVPGGQRHIHQRGDGEADSRACRRGGEGVERLEALEAEVAELDPQAAGQSVFRDPERLSEAEEAAAKVREGGAPPPGPSAAFPLAAFAVGASNQVAVSAARAALERPGKKYNPLVGRPRDRKSTRLNSSHQIISYAVICLKKQTHSAATGRTARR